MLQAPALGANAETAHCERPRSRDRDLWAVCWLHALEPLDLAAYAERPVPIDVVIGHERTQRPQVVKQADVVALIALLPVS